MQSCFRIALDMFQEVAAESKMAANKPKNMYSGDI